MYTTKILMQRRLLNGTFSIITNSKEEVEKLLHRNLSREDFPGKLKDCLLYYFWAKSEYEILISPRIGDAKDIKVDIFDQVMINFERFVDYVWHFSEVENGEK